MNLIDPPGLTADDVVTGEWVTWARPWAAGAHPIRLLGKYGLGPFRVIAKDTGESASGILLTLERTDGIEGSLIGFDPGWFIKSDVPDTRPR